MSKKAYNDANHKTPQEGNPEKFFGLNAIAVFNDLQITAIALEESNGIVLQPKDGKCFVGVANPFR